MPIGTHYVVYKRKTINIFGTLIAVVSSLGWKTNSTKILISENHTRYLLGLDLQIFLSVQTTRTRSIPIRETSSPSKWRIFLIENFKDTFTRQGRSKKHRVHSVFKGHLVPVQGKRRRQPIHIHIFKTK